MRLDLRLRWVWRRSQGQPLRPRSRLTMRRSRSSSRVAAIGRVSYSGMKAFRALAALLVLIPALPRAEDPEPDAGEPKVPPRWLWAVPGGGQFALGQTGAGWAWLG